jgi:glycosyltransferase involved in cell wall biosynthesis
MNRFTRIVFWEPSVSPHKSDLFRAILALRPGIELLHVAQSALSPDRQAMGWIAPIPVGYSEILAPSEQTCKEIATHNPDSTFHVFSGMRHVPCIVIGLRAVQVVGACFALMSEPRVSEGLKGIFRYLQSWATEGALRKEVSCVFAIGRNGPAWFESVGYSHELVFPFAYFIEQLVFDHVRLQPISGPIRVGYLGRLVRPKGIFTLLDAFAQFSKSDAVLELAGPVGPEDEAVRSATRLCTAVVNRQGAIPMSGVAAFLSDLDVLVLPSITKDGWGVVVTEALMMGVPVVATSCVGASVVLNDARLGAVVDPCNSMQLAAAIRSVTQSHNLTPSAKAWRVEWARCHLTAQAGAKYFWEVLDHRLDGAARPTSFFE